MRRELRCRTELWTLDEPFVIAGLVQRETQLIVVEIGVEGHVGRGETERDDLLATLRQNSRGLGEADFAEIGLQLAG